MSHHYSQKANNVFRGAPVLSKDKMVPLKAHPYSRKANYLIQGLYMG
jgi:hypothetical protein